MPRRRNPSVIEEQDGLILIRSIQGPVAVVDAADRHLVEGFAWQATPPRSSNAAVYFVRRFRHEGIIKTEFLHRRLLSAPPDLVVDHIDGNGLNNRRSNIRLCTKAENSANVLRRSGTGAVGVYKGVGYNGYYARISINGERRDLGSFKTIEQASAAYMAARAIPEDFYRRAPAISLAP